MDQHSSDHARSDALADRLRQGVLHTIELSHVWLGDRLGLYAALAELGKATPAELSKAAGIAERYAREWLEQQAVAAILDVAESSRDAAERRYSLPAEHAEVLLDPESLRHMVPLTLAAIGVVRTLPQVRQAFRTGAGVPYADFHEDRGNGTGNRPMFTHFLATEWVPAMPDVHARLLGAASARIADLGCGPGWSTIALAKGYPSARVVGIDLDPRSIAEAARNVAEAGVADRVTFHNASADTLEGTYDLVCAFECLHDMSDPASVLRAARSRVAEGGVMLVAEERVAEEFTAPGDENERFHYGWSAVHCLPTSLVEQPSAAIGTAIRPSTVRSLAMSAGFSRVDILPVDHDAWLFYRFTP